MERSLRNQEADINLPPTITGSFSGDAAEFQSSLASEPYLILAAVVVIYLLDRKGKAVANKEAQQQIAYAFRWTPEISKLLLRYQAERAAYVDFAAFMPELIKAFADSGMLAASSTPAALAARIAAEQRYWEPIIRASGIRAE